MATTTLYTPWNLDSFDPSIAGVAPIVKKGTAVDNTQVAAVQAAALATLGYTLATTAGGGSVPVTTSVPQSAVPLTAGQLFGSDGAGNTVAVNPTGSSELASAENNTATTTTAAAGSGAVDVVGCSIVVPASSRPVYLHAMLMIGCSAGASTSTPLFPALKITEVSNGTDTPITWNSGACIVVNTAGAFPVILPLRRLGATVRTRTFKLQFTTPATGGTWTVFNGNSGVEPSRIAAMAL